MTKDSIRKLEEALQEINVPDPITTASIEEERLQNEGNETDFVVDELQRLKKLVNERYKDESDHRKTIYDLRKKYIPKLFWMVVVWLIFVSLIVVFTALGCLQLSDAVLIALITTTTATVLGIFVIVAKWLFPSQSSESLVKVNSKN